MSITSKIVKALERDGRKILKERTAITDEDIWGQRDRYASESDWLHVAICDKAMGRTWHHVVTNKRDRARIEKMSKDECRRFCAITKSIDSSR